MSNCHIGSPTWNVLADLRAGPLRPVASAIFRRQIAVMAIQLNHTIVHSADPSEGAKFLSDVLGLPPPRRFGHFLVVETANGVSLDFMSSERPIEAQHYAFLVSESEFDAIFERIGQHGLQYWADPQARRPGEINRNDGGRGVYFQDPSGHFLEILTRPYGSGS
jgi:catechol 2,3-dioxygenase-like lactoylglutathione lyase family enzyme